MMSKDEETVLSAAVEDFTGLWELVWELGGVSEGAHTARERAQAAARKLLSTGMIKLYRRPRLGGAEEDLSGSEVASILDEPASWNEPSADSVQFVIAATEFGTRTYEGGS